MELLLKRRFKGPKYTIGSLYINDIYECDTIEDTDRGLHNNMPEEEIKLKKIYGQTAIPYGKYKIDMNTVSPKFSSYSFYKNICSGKVPRLCNVLGFDGILIHVANGPKGAELVKGCIGVGFNTIKGGLTEGKQVFTNLYKTLLQAKATGEDINITIE